MGGDVLRDVVGGGGVMRCVICGEWCHMRCDWWGSDVLWAVIGGE